MDKLELECKYILLRKLSEGYEFLNLKKMPFVLRVLLKAFLKIANDMYIKGYR